jgi:putative CocE/NonD family hydrolase
MNNGVEREQAVTYYVMGDTTDPSAPGNVWRTASTWPPAAKETPWYFQPNHSLLTTMNRPDGYLEYAYNPADPVPTTGGNHLSLPSGPLEQKAVEDRADVLVFSSEPLKEPLEVTGRIRAKLWVSSDAPDTDFTAKLCDVYPDGRSLNICDGILRARFRKSLSKPELMQPGRVYFVEIDLWSTSMVFNKGHRLRVQISSSNAPAYDPNPNTGAQLRADSRTQVAHNRIYLDARHPSQIILPIPANEK